MCRLAQEQTAEAEISASKDIVEDLVQHNISHVAKESLQEARLSFFLPSFLPKTTTRKLTKSKSTLLYYNIFVTCFHEFQIYESTIFFRKKILVFF